MTSNTKTRTLSVEGMEMLADPIMHAVLSEAASRLGVSAEEYLLRFEEVLSHSPEKIFAVFEEK